MPAEAVVWFNPSCSKCRLAADALEAAGASFVVRRYLEDPPSVDELAAVLDRLGLEPWDITRTADAAALGLSLDVLPRERSAWIEVLAAYPALIQRPIILTEDGSAWVARDAGSVAAAVAATGRDAG
jgi:arsenate reductase